MNRHDPSGVLRTTATSLTLIDHILELRGAAVGELAEATDLAKNAIHAHLRTLAEYGHVVDVNNEYHLGVEFCHLGDYIRTRKNHYRVTQETVSRLDNESSMDADFAVEEHGRIVSLYGGLEFTDTPRFLIDGSPFHVHTTCSGKAIVAEYPETRVREIIDRWRLLAATDDSITTEDELFAGSITIREQGYVENSSKAIEGFWAIGKAVRSPRGEMYGSLNLNDPTYVIDEEARTIQVELLERAARRFKQGVAELYQIQANGPDEE